MIDKLSSIYFAFDLFLTDCGAWGDDTTVSIPSTTSKSLMDPNFPTRHLPVMAWSVSLPSAAAASFLPTCGRSCLSSPAARCSMCVQRPGVNIMLVIAER